MNAVKFDFLKDVEIIGVDKSLTGIGSQVEIKLHNTMHRIEPEYITAFVDLDVKEIERYVVNGNDVKVPCFYIDADAVCLIDDFDNVHACQDMPFKLTGHQLHTINSYLEDFADK